MELYNKILEWESLKWPIVISNLTCVNKFYNLPSDSKIEIDRNQEYHLSAKLTTAIKDDSEIEYNHPHTLLAGQFMKGEKIVGYVNPYSKIEIEDFLIGSRNSKFDIKNERKIIVNANCSISRIEESPESTNKIEKELEFYLCGRLQIHFPHSTKRAVDIKYLKKRFDYNDKDKANKILSRTHGSSNDFIHIKTDHLDFYIQLVPKDFLPSWATGIQIEYTKGENSLPSDETKKGISEIVGFIFGTQLIKIGSSELNKNDNPIRRKAINHWVDNVISLCSKTTEPPIKLDDYEKWGFVEKVLRQVVPTYLRLRDTYNLSDVLWKYFISKELPIGTNLPILSSGLEALSESYLKVNGLLPEYTNDAKDKYKNEVVNDITSLREKIKSYPFANSILDKIANPFNLGGGEKQRLFFNSLGLNFSRNSIESQALRARNKMTHTSIGVEEKQIKEYIKLTHAYESLFNRTLLKILEYEGEYIDYYTDGHPLRELLENIE